MLSESQVVEIRRRIIDGEKAVDLAAEFGISASAIRLISLGDSYPKFGGPLRARANRKGRVIGDDEVIEMRRLYDAGNSILKISLQFGVSHKAAQMAVLGHTHTHIPGACKPKRSRLKQDDIDRVTQGIENGRLSYREAAQQLNVSASYVWRIVHRPSGEQALEPSLSLDDAREYADMMAKRRGRRFMVLPVPGGYAVQTYNRLSPSRPIYVAPPLDT